MEFDPYMACPCGSGKKFKWCCMEIHAEIDEAMRQQENGQHEAALRTIDGIVAKHETNAEVWGRKAQLLHANGRAEEAEQALDKAFSLNPDYAFGYLLKGMFRQSEGEVIGSMILFRKAAELYAHDAVEQLTFLFEQIGNNEMRRNHPVAGRWALDRLRRLHPENAELVRSFDAVFGETSRVPDAARKEYALMGTDANRPAAWKDAIALGRSDKLGAAAKAFDELSKQPKPDPLTWYNLGLLRAWLGENLAAIDAIEKYVEKERDEQKAIDAAALIEVLRLGEDAVQVCDYILHRMLLQFRDANPVMAMLQEWDEAGRMIGVRQNEEEGMISGLVLKKMHSLIGAQTATYAPLAGYFLIAGDVVSIWNVNPESVALLNEEIKEKLGPALGESRSFTSAAQFGDIVMDAILFPMYGKVPGELGEKLVEQARAYFEDQWANRPLKSLAGNTPIDAAAHPVLRRKVLGIVQLLEQCLHASQPRRGDEIVGQYQFDRLRHRLGLDGAAPELPGPSIDFSSLSAADLAALDVNELSIDQLEKAYRSAIALDAGELAAKYVRTLLARPADANRPDLYPFVKFLVDQAQSQADWGKALAAVEEGEKLDAERNEGKRRNDYLLRRGQLYGKKNELDKAFEVFNQLVNESPSELKYRGSAAEAMLSLRQGVRARDFAQAGLEEARKQNNRDMEAYFQELVGAAKKLGG